MCLLNTVTTFYKWVSKVLILGVLYLKFAEKGKRYPEGRKEVRECERVREKKKQRMKERDKSGWEKGLGKL